MHTYTLRVVVVFILDEEDEKDEGRKRGVKRDISPIHFPKSGSPTESVGKENISSGVIYICISVTGKMTCGHIMPVSMVACLI